MTAPTTGTASATSISKKTLGYLVQLGGIAALTLGAVFSLHHVAIGAAYLGGAAAFYGRRQNPRDGVSQSRAVS
jgi:hypothetical protein